MPDREKVIKGLEHCKIGDCVGCPYDQTREESLHGKHNKWELICNEKLTEDILALLKEQPHGETFTVIDTKTGKEADEYNIALHEEWAKHLCYCDMEGWAIENDGSLLLVDECGRFAYADKERFKVVWDA